MKRTIILLLLLLPTFFANSQDKYPKYYYQRASLFEALPATTDDILFVGNSITDGGEWCELFDNKHVKNRGISGDVTNGVYDRLDGILKTPPAKIFLLIGINDLGRGAQTDSVVIHTDFIINKIKQLAPSTRIYLQSILPVNDCYGLFEGHTSRWKDVPVVNAGLQKLAKKHDITYIDLFSSFKESKTDKMNPQYSNDGLHLLGIGYLKWAEIIEKYIKE